ncbi:MAG: hypothetical protein GEV28_26635 [Actinophytocola sp.]|uniref:hypothetical protein n=1 Tax=Actinophytocola sp. TaxID=1872138 RepID=UPI00132483EA|nr:hypothetical protein [Actinophytocola sp.]MPZ83775.1 hypothetical protein [Actinophytocola sp.]
MPNNGMTPRYSALERAQMKVLDKAGSLAMAPTLPRVFYDQFGMTVHAVTELHPNLRRITFRADELGGYRPGGVDSREAK